MKQPFGKLRTKVQDNDFNICNEKKLYDYYLKPFP